MTTQKINLTDENAIEKLESKLQSAILLQDRMKSANIIIRSKHYNEEQKIALLKEQFNLPVNTIHALMNPQYSFQSPGFPQWQLSNNNQEINRLKKRIKEVLKYQEQCKFAIEIGNIELEFDEFKIIDNVIENRIQILFNDKPETAIRQKLKINGFRWAPSQGVWQAYRSSMSLERTKTLLSVN